MSLMLLQFLVELDLVARPKKRATAINNSGLSLLKSRLLGYIEKPFNKKFFLIGSEVHKRVLEPKKRIKKFIKAEELLIRGMVAALQASPIMQALLKDSIKEKKLKGTVLGCKMHGTLDINKKAKKLIADIKTTSGKTKADCIKSCIQYGYFRQALVYMALAGAKDFIFIFVTKSVPHKIFFVDVKDYPNEMAYAKEELKFLLHIYTKYGMPNPVKYEAKNKLEFKAVSRRTTR